MLFPPPIRYFDRISKRVLAAMAPSEFGMSSSAFVCAMNADQAGYFILYSAGGRNADCWGIKPAR